jgi:putative flippase GtrA
LKKFINSELIRFLLGGLLNTIITYLIYLYLIIFFNYLFAFSVTFLIGIVFAFIINSMYVFKTPLKLRRFIQYPVIYSMQYFLGLIILFLLVNYFHISQLLAPLFNIFILVPFTFILNRHFLKGSFYGK